MLSREVQQVVRALCRRTRVNPLVEAARAALASGDVQRIVSAHVDPFQFSDAHTYLEAAVLANFLRKYQGLAKPDDLHDRAVETFFECERTCFRTNLRLSREENPRLLRFLDYASRVVAEVLGPVPNILHGRHGPGVTFGTSSRTSLVPDKMSASPTLTPDAWIFCSTWAETAWARSNRARGVEVTCVQGNRFTSVPKDATKNRGICIEPSINVFYQLAYGSAIRARLKRFGIDLDHGQQTHREAAREGSVSGEFCTIDLSNASDTVAHELVRLMLPKPWFDQLDRLRSPQTLLGGQWHRLEKFSSMGNGFTFELETLIFYALAQACQHFLGVGHRVLVYGDDIIVHRDVVGELLQCLRYCGFTPNPKKTFTNGSFRESCGGDFFGGEDVRPYFLKKEPTEPHELIGLCNGLRRLIHRFPPGHPFRNDLGIAASGVERHLPSHVRSCRGPVELGDLVLHDDNPRSWNTRLDQYRQIRWIRTWEPVPAPPVIWAHWHPDVVNASALLGVGDGRRGVTPPNVYSGHKLGWAAYS